MSTIKVHLKILKRRIPLTNAFLKNEELKKHIGTMNGFTFFYRNFETRLRIFKGDVFVAQLSLNVGNELSGPHFVVALNDSDCENQLVTVVPLKSSKGKEINPASDICLGEIDGLEGKEAIAIINQIKTIDKRRLFARKTILRLNEYICDDTIHNYQEFVVEDKNVYRLKARQMTQIVKAVREFFDDGYIHH